MSKLELTGNHAQAETPPVVTAMEEKAEKKCGRFRAAER